MRVWTVYSDNHEAHVFASVKEVLEFTGTEHNLEGDRQSKSTRKALELALAQNRVVHLYSVRDENEARGVAGWRFQVQAHDLQLAPQQELAGAVICAYQMPGDVRIELTKQRDGTPMWAARQFGMCLSAAGEWEHEPQPSSRTEKFLARCRFATPEAAAAAVVGVQEGSRQ